MRSPSCIRARVTDVDMFKATEDLTRDLSADFNSCRRMWRDCQFTLQERERSQIEMSEHEAKCNRANGAIYHRNRNDTAHEFEVVAVAILSHHTRRVLQVQRSNGSGADGICGCGGR